MPKEINHLETFNNVIQKDQLTVVDFTATWCGPCKQIAPWFEEKSKEFPAINFCKCDVDKASEISSKEGVQCMPTFKFYKSGKLYKTIEGADKTALEEMFKATDEDLEKILIENENAKKQKEKFYQLMPQITSVQDYNNKTKDVDVFVNFFVDKYNDDTDGLKTALFDKLTAEPDAFKVYSVDLAEHGQVGNAKAVRKLPCVHCFKNGKLVKTISENKIEELVNFNNLSNDEVQVILDEQERLKVPQLDKIEEYNELINKENLTVVDFYATWCGPCINFASTYQKMKNDEKFKDVNFAKIDCDINTEAKTAADIKCFPTFKLFKNGKELGKLEGANEKSLTVKIEECRKM